MKKDPAIEAYLAEARSWELDRAKQSDRSKKVAWVVAGAFFVLAAGAITALAGLTPLKRTEPYVIRVDSSSGVVDVVPAYTGTDSVEELVTRNLLNGHVIARERYFYGTAESDYELVGAESTPAQNQKWMALWDKANPESPLNLYKDGTTIRVQIRAITFLKMESGKTVAQVRFSKFARPGGTGEEQATHWVSTIDFAYTTPSKDEKLRSLNPLGFKVVEYQREPEVVTQAISKGGR
jgi:type IV secretion system protein VirB8